MALQFRRGTDSDRLTITPGAGEPIWSTDTEKLYVGDGTTAGGIAVGNDSAEINVIIQNKLGNVSGNIIPDTDSAYDLGSPTNKFKDLYLSGNSIYLGDNLILRNDAGTLVAEDSSATPVSISLSSNTTSDLAEGSNLYYTTARADSDAKNAISASGDLTYNSTTGTFSVTTYKSADFDTDLGTKTTADLTEGSNLYFTDARADARVEATADSAYVQARQIKYTNADFADSSFVTAQINNLIDGAPGTLDTLNEIAAALNDDDSAYSTLVGLINAKSDLDSTDAIALIDSAYVQARQTTYDFLDSSEAIALIDSAYVQARQSAGTDSAAVIALIDSDYVQARQVDPVSAFTIVSVSGQDDLVADNSEGGANWSTSTETGDLEPNDSVSSQRYGHSTDVSDDGLYVVAGSPYNNGPGATQAGRAFIHYYNGSTWSVQQRLDPPGADVVNYLNYGWAVAIDADGDTAAVSARNSNTNGRVYVYTRSSTTWSLQATLSPDTSVSSSGGYFGISVDISEDGNMITVGHQEGRSANGTTRRMGTVEVFTRSGSTWTRAETIEESTSDFPTDAKIGTSNELASEDKDRIIFGAYTDKSAWVWVNSGGWARESELTPSNSPSSQNDSYGTAVSINADGTVAAVSDPGADGESSETKAGNVYIFTRSGSTWTQQQRLYSATQNAGDLFGQGLNLSGDGTRVFISVSREDASSTTEGEVQIWKNTGGTWALESTVNSSDTTSSQNNRFGAEPQSVAVTKDATYLAVGARDPGAVYVYTAATGASLSDRLTLEAGSNITITTDANTDTVTIAASSAIDSAGTIALIDSAYVQARQTTYTNADFADSAFVTTQINNLIDAAPGALDTLNELAAAIGDDANFSTTITNQIAGKLDSAQATALIDSAYVQARQTTGTDSAATISLIQANSVDSAEVISLIDSAYVAERTTAGTDSAAIINLIDSAYVAARTTAGTDSAAIINLIDSNYVQARQVYSSDILLQIDSDLTTTDSSQVVHSFNKSIYRTVKYTAQLENDDTSSYHAEEILLTHDGTNIAISSYSKLTLDSDLGEFDAQITGNNVELTLTPTNANTHVKLRAIAMSEGAANSNGLIIAVDSDLTTTDSAQTIHTFDKTNFRTLKYVAQLTVASTGDYHAQEILLTHNGTNVAMTGYAKILLDSDLGTFDALINGNNVELKLSPTKANTNVKLRAIRTLA